MFTVDQSEDQTCFLSSFYLRLVAAFLSVISSFCVLSLLSVASSSVFVFFPAPLSLSPSISLNRSHLPSLSLSPPACLPQSLSYKYALFHLDHCLSVPGKPQKDEEKTQQRGGMCVLCDDLPEAVVSMATAR